MSDPWDGPEGQTQHCAACEDEVNGHEPALQHRCSQRFSRATCRHGSFRVIEATTCPECARELFASPVQPKEPLAQHGTWFWAGTGDDRMRVIVDAEQPEGKYTFVSEQPRVKKERS